MRIFLAGATGVIGLRLIPLLLSEGHVVAGMTRSPEKLESLSDLGAEPVLCDVFDECGLRSAVTDFRPDLVMHQVSDVPDEVEPSPELVADNKRTRIQATFNLLAAKWNAGARRFVAQSIAWTPPVGSEAVAEHESLVLDARGLVIRYGAFYGPGTHPGGRIPPSPRIHVDEAARRTVQLLEAPPGLVVVAEQAS